MYSKKGFTLIELLVVIAIIGILAAIVLVSLKDAPARARDAAIKSDVEQVRTQATLLWTDNGSYSALCDSGHLATSTPALATIQADIQNQQGGTLSLVCNTDGDNYCVSVPLKTQKAGADQWFCVDSDGRSGNVLTADPCDTTAYDCLP